MSFINALSKFVSQFLNSKEKGVSKMKRIILTVSMLLATAMCFSVAAYAASIDKTASVTASAKISGVTSLSADVSAFAYGNPTATPPVAPAGDVFPTTPASKRVVLTYGSNYNPWKVAVYTNNTQIPKKSVDTVNGMYAKGGLVAGTTPGGYSIVPMKWITKAPASTAPSAAAIVFQTTYNFVKDKNDENDPATDVDNPTTPNTDEVANESWDTPIVVGSKTYPGAFSSGYPTIAWGPVVGGGGVCVDPTNTAVGDNQYKGDALSGTVAVYIAGLFATGGVTPAVPAAAGDYSGTIYFDLYHP